MEIKEMKDIPLDKHKIDLLVYGKGGTGKTILGSTFPRPIYIDVEGGLLSVRKKKVSFLSCHRPVSSSTGETNFLAWWQEIKKATAMAISSPNHDSIIIDSFSSVYDALLGAVEGSPQVRTKGGEVDGYKKWDLLWEWALNYISLLRGCDKNTLFICGETFDQDDTGRAFFYPSLIGKGKSKTIHYFDEFYHSEVETKGERIEYKLRIRPSGQYTAKSRVLSEGDSTSLINPNYEDVKKLLMK